MAAERDRLLERVSALEADLAQERELRLRDLEERARRYEQIRDQALAATASVRQTAKSIAPKSGATSGKLPPSDTSPSTPPRLPGPPRLPRRT
jgi:hypothetical protein